MKHDGETTLDEAAIRASERLNCTAEITAYANETLAPIIGAAYRDAARLLIRPRRPADHEIWLREHQSLLEMLDQERCALAQQLGYPDAGL